MTSGARAIVELPAPLTPRTFLESYWQKRPLAMPAGVPSIEPTITADELAWLATQPDVESRLVTTQQAGDRMRYRVNHGPFSERRLRHLPASDWTLLVHDVDKHLPDFRAWLDAVPFVPDWRIDDLLISVAAPGGSVGPHRDCYDVFLCQASGRREWHVAEASEAVPARGRSGLALLEPFRSATPIEAQPGDVLYLPPAVPHWGIAVDTCITCSIGMRAPTRDELVAAVRRIDPGAFRDSCKPSSARVTPRYADPDLQPDESSPGEISAPAIERAVSLLAPGADTERPDRALVARALGSVVTTPKEWLAPDAPEEEGEVDELARQLEAATRCRLHGMARLAWCVPVDGDPLVFVNGREQAIGAGLLAPFRRLCADREMVPGRCTDWLAGEPGKAFFRWLIAAGTFDHCDVESVKCEEKSGR